MPQKKTPPYTFNDAVIDEIFGQPQPDETPASRLKQVGLMMMLHRMQRQGVETTMPRTVAATGVSRAAATVILKPLLTRGTLIESRIRNVTGKGHAIRLDFCAQLRDLE